MVPATKGHNNEMDNLARDRVPKQSQFRKGSIILKKRLPRCARNDIKKTL
jgi:hypothetical protein